VSRYHRPHALRHRPHCRVLPSRAPAVVKVRLEGRRVGH
jgi:hypothetical protein